MTVHQLYKYLGCFFIISLLTIKVFAQQIDHHCGTDDATNRLIQTDSTLVNRMSLLEQAVQLYISQHPENLQRGMVTIPIVVHVMNSGTPIGIGSNISDEQVLSELQVLDNDYQRLSADTGNVESVWKPIAANFGMQFVMAVRDPNGKPTNGIDRISGYPGLWTPSEVDGTIKPKTIWDYKHYLNIWTIDFNPSTSVLGYTIIPLATNGSIDGVVIGFPYYGLSGGQYAPYNIGRTVTHEIGHWFGLYHPWGKTTGAYVDTCDGVGSGIPDVPAAAEANFGCPNFPRISCNDGPNGDMFQNYMDYVNDNCMNLFTVGQKTYAYGILYTLRDSNLVSLVATRFTLDAAMKNVRLPGTQVCSSTFKPVVEISNEGTVNLTSVYINYNVDNTTDGEYYWTGNLATGQSQFVTLDQLSLSAGKHFMNFYVTTPNSGKDEYNMNDAIADTFEVNAENQVGQSLPLTQNFEGGFPVNWIDSSTTNTAGSIKWQVNNSIGADGSTASVWVNNFAGTRGTNSRGNRAYIYLPAVSVDTGQYPFMTFDVAYAQRLDSTSNDALMIEYSMDCGVTWNQIYEKFGAALASTAPVSVSYVPATGDWRLDEVILPEAAGQGNILIRFDAYSDWGNNIYVDNINLGQYALGINPVIKPSIGLVISPNPSTGKFIATFDTPLPRNSTLEVFDMLGRSVYYNADISGSTVNFDITGKSDGVYFAKVVSGNTSIVKKLVIHSL